MLAKKDQYTLDAIRYVERVTVGSINPGVPFGDEQRQGQLAYLNRCLNEHPKGKIIARDISVASYAMGEHQLTMQLTTYHIGFPRKPSWIK